MQLMRILVVEDEHKIARAIKRGLEHESYAVDLAYDSDDASEAVTDESYDLVVLDQMLPGSTDGIGLLKKMRQNNIHTPVIFLTAKDRIGDKVEGLNAGADDYLVKPFAFDELLARVRALMRRPKESKPSVLKYEDLELDPVNFSVFRSKQSIKLTQKEFALLEYFMRNPGRVLTKSMIIQHVWDYDAEVTENSVEVYLGYLRNKIDKPFGGKQLFQTRHGFGYVFGGKDV